MIKQTIFFFSLLIGLFLVSCTANVPVDNTTEKKIPIDSFSLSFKLNNQLIELKSPTASLWSVGKTVRRLYKVQNSPKDSSIFGYYYGFANANYEVEFGFSRVLLVDTLISKIQIRQTWKTLLLNRAICIISLCHHIHKFKANMLSTVDFISQFTK